MRVSRTVVGIALASFGLSLAIPSPSSAMTTLAEPDGVGHPGVVALLMVDGDGATRLYCSGMLISSDVVATAGHCNAFAERLVAAGWRLAVTNDAELRDADVNGWTSISKIDDWSWSSVVANPLYEKGYRDDVSAQRLSEPLTSVTQGDFGALPPVGLLDEVKKNQQLRSRQSLVLGYGREEKPLPANVGSAKPFTNERRFAYMDNLALDKQWLHQQMLIALGQSGACNGDSGGPTLMTVDGIEYLVAVTSTGDMPCFATNVSSRTDTPTAGAFLRSLI